jgi:hypothetical protein
MRIAVNRNDDIRYWAERLGVSRARLIAAIAAAGPNVRDVEARIRRERSARGEGENPPANRERAFRAYD